MNEIIKADGTLETTLEGARILQEYLSNNLDMICYQCGFNINSLDLIKIIKENKK